MSLLTLLNREQCALFGDEQQWMMLGSMSIFGSDKDIKLETCKQTSFQTPHAISNMQYLSRLCMKKNSPVLQQRCSRRYWNGKQNIWEWWQLDAQSLYSFLRRREGLFQGLSCVCSLTAFETIWSSCKSGPRGVRRLKWKWGVVLRVS